MRIGETKKQKNKKPLGTINKFIIGFLAFFLVFLSGALFQQRGLDNKLYGLAKDFRFTLINEFNLVQNNGLQSLYVDIPYKSLDKIYQKREAALAAGVLMSSDEDYVPARIRLDQGEELDVDIRLKGDWTDHLNTNKWSYRVHVKDGKMVLGTKRFSIQAPETRNYVAEWAFHQHCLYEGILTTKFTFLNVYENGVYKGIYAFEESFSEELIESQEERQGLILKFDEEVFWADRAAYIQTGSYWMALENNLFNVTDSVDSSEVLVFRENHLEEDALLHQQKEQAIAVLTGYLEGKISVAEAFDIEKTGKYYAMVDFWAANHSAHWINMRFYFNPVTGLIEPLAFDGIALIKFTNRDFLGYELNKTTLLDEPAIRSVYALELQRLTNSENFEVFKNTILDQAEQYQKTLEREYSSLESIWGLIEERRKILNVLANPNNPIKGNFDAIQDLDKLIIKIRLKNLTMFPIEIKQIQINDQIFPFTGQLLDETQSNDIVTLGNTIFLNFNKTAKDLTLPETHIKIPLPVDQEQDFENIVVKVTVGVGKHEKEVLLSQLPLNRIYTIEQSLIPTSTVDEVLILHPFLVFDGGDNFLVTPGTWNVKGDLIIPEGKNLTIAAGANLLFEKDELLLLRSGTLNILGTPDNTSSLTSIGEPWAGILVIDAPDESFIQSTEISNITGFEREGWMVTGGITFYQSNVTITNSVIKDSFAEDAINVMHSNYLFDNLSIVNTVSDAFDGDFSDGKIINSYFAEISGDAVDISGSNLEITSCDFNAIGDKGISAGEQSQVKALFLNITNANIGIASKDSSYVEIELSEINNPSYIAMAAYQKKEMFGPGQIIAKTVAIDTQDKVALVQSGSQIKLNEVIFPDQELDVKTLYDLGILGN
jgi:hypothetical protein